MKFHSKPVPEHEEVPLADDGRWEKIVEKSKQRTTRPGAPGQGNSCYVLSVSAERDPLIREAQLAEIRSLVLAQGDRIVGEESYRLTKSRPDTLIGKGTAREVADRARSAGADLLVLDAELTPSQMRNIEDAAGIAVCDREAVILNVFLRHARTNRARIQVEIAQLEYLRPRICGIGLDMDQQAGGIGGGRGPGETASELLARKLDRRLAELKKAQRRHEQSGVIQRRQRDACKRVVLVGYTNAGKTALMNALAGESLSSRDQPFETLDTTSRCLTRHGGEVLLCDTVGFIRRLPERLMASFESTLSEIREASLLLIVVDASDHEWKRHVATTVGFLEKLGALKIPRLYVFNKADRLGSPPEPAILEQQSEGHPYVVLSSRDPAAVELLKEEALRKVRGEQPERTLLVPYAAGKTMSLIYARCRVIASEPAPEGLRLTFQAEPRIIAEIERGVRELGL
jgi:GTPase